MTSRTLKILAAPGDASACGYYRVLAPLAAMERAGLAEIGYPIEVMLPNGKPDLRIRIDAIKDYDVIVFQRQTEERIAFLLKTAREVGTKSVFDVDDDLFSVPPSSPAYLAFGKDWRKIGGMGKMQGRPVQRFPRNGGMIASPEKQEYAALEHAAHQWTDRTRENFNGLIRNLRLADLVTVSTEPLRRVYSIHRPDVHVLRNQVEPLDWKDAIAAPHGKPDDEVWIGWAGSKTHWVDLKEIAPAIVQVLRRNADARMVLLGYPEASSLFDEVQEQVITFDWMPITEYRSVVAAFDVALAPSASIRFNEAKSDIRVLEAALCGTPVVASETTYGDTMREAGCGFVAKTPQKWQRHVEQLIKDASLRSALGEKGREYVLGSRTYDANAQRWARAYSKLIEEA